MSRHLSLVGGEDGPATEGHNAENPSQSLAMDLDKYNFLKAAVLSAQAGTIPTLAEVEAATEKHTAAKAAVKKARKTFEANGGSLAEFDFIIELISMKDPDAARARLIRLWTYATYEGLELPKADVAKDPYAKLPTLARQQQVWYEKGFLAASEKGGVNPTEWPEHTPADMQQHWSRGVMAKYEQIAKSMSRMGPLFEAEAAAKLAAANKQSAGPDDEDEGDGDDEEVVAGAGDAQNHQIDAALAKMAQETAPE